MKHNHTLLLWCAAALLSALQSTGFSLYAAPPTNNLVVWLKADTGVNTQPPSSAVAVYGLADQAPGGTHGATLATGASTELRQAAFPNGQHAVVHFGGTGGFILDNPAGLRLADMSIYLVGSLNNALASKSILTCYEDLQDGFTIGGWVFGINDAVAGQVKWFSCNPNPDTLSPSAAALENNTPTLMTASFNSLTGTKTLYINSTEAGSETGLAPIFYSGYEVGTVGYLVPTSNPRQQFVGDIAEIIVFSTVDETQRANVEAYLSAKYFTSTTVVEPPTNNMVLWLRADTGVNTNSPTGTTPVYGWTDQAPDSQRFGTARGAPVLAQATFPNGQHPVMRLGGSSGFALDGAAGLQLENLSVYLVASADNSYAGKGFITCYNDSAEGATMGGWVLGISDSSVGVVKWFSTNPGGDTLTPSEPLAHKTPTLITATFDNVNSQKTLYINSAQAGVESGVSPIYYSGREVLALGYLAPMRQQVVGDIAEVIVYNAVDNIQRAKVEAYLNAKYFTSATPVAPPTTGMVLWFKADAGVVTVAPVAVATWTNQVSAGLHSARPNKRSTAPTLTSAPFPNGQHSVIRFNGAGGFTLDTPNLGIQDVSVYLVGRLDGSVRNSQEFIGNSSDGGGGWGLGIDDGAPGVVKWFTSGNAYESCPLDDSTPTWITATISGTTGQKALYFNSTNVATDSGVPAMTYNAASVGLSVGQYNNWPGANSQFIIGDIAEILVFSTVDAAQQTSVETYMQRKYFLSNPPANLAPPTNNLVIWLRADAGVNTNQGKAIYDWYDQAPGALHSATPTYAGGDTPALVPVTFPTGQGSAVNFDGACGFALNNSAGLQLPDLSIYLIGSVNNTLAAKSIVTCYEDGSDGFTIGGWVLGIDDAVAGQVKWFSCNPSPDTLSPLGALGNNVPTLMTATFDSVTGNKLLYVNRTQAGIETELAPIYYSGHEVATLGWLIPAAGPRQQLNGNIAELLIYSTVDTNQQAAVEAYLQNKYLSLAPTLRIGRTSGNQLILSWDASGFIVQKNTNLAAPTGWTDVSGTSPLTVTIEPTGQFFRLRSQ